MSLIRAEFDPKHVALMAGDLFDRLTRMIELEHKQQHPQSVTLLYGTLDGSLNAFRSMLTVMRIRSEQDEDLMRATVLDIEALREDARQIMIRKGLNLPPIPYPSAESR